MALNAVDPTIALSYKGHMGSVYHTEDSTSFSTSSSSSSDSSGSNFFCITLFSRNFRSATADSAALSIYNASIALLHFRQVVCDWNILFLRRYCQRPFASANNRIRHVKQSRGSEKCEGVPKIIFSTEKQNGIPNGIEFGEAFRFKTITCLLPDFLHCNRSLLVVLVLHWASFIYIYFVSLVLFSPHASYLWTYQWRPGRESSSYTNSSTFCGIGE